jgi:hypothetical protein
MRPISPMKSLSTHSRPFGATRIFGWRPGEVSFTIRACSLIVASIPNDKWRWPLVDGSSMTAICIWAQSRTSIMWTIEAIARLLEENQAEVESIFAGALRRAQHTGELPGEQSPGALAKFFARKFTLSTKKTPVGGQLGGKFLKRDPHDSVDPFFSFAGVPD